ncbi:MAG: FAD-binding oxidoreductase [Planctomycetota bacterium]
MPIAVDELVAILQQSQGVRTLLPRGLATRPVVAVAKPRAQAVTELNLAQMPREIDLDPDEMVVTVTAGTPLADLDAAARAHGLFVPPILTGTPLDARMPGQHGLLAGTIGGLYSDPRELSTSASLGRVRDHVLGIEAVRGDGTPFKSGGRVVKNVTGYDVTRFLCGARGRWGVITKLHWRLQPRPQQAASAQFEFGTASELWRGVDAIRDCGREPLDAWVMPDEHILGIVEASRGEFASTQMQHYRELLQDNGGTEIEPAAPRGTTAAESCNATTLVRVRAPYSRWATLTNPVAGVQWERVHPFADFALARLPHHELTPTVAALLQLRQQWAPLGATLAVEAITPDLFGLDRATLHGTDEPSAVRELAQRLHKEWDPHGTLDYEAADGP